MWIVVMIEPWRIGEPKLSVTDQINESFGPFESDEAADHWVARMQEAYRGMDRIWLIKELSDPGIVNKLNPEGN